MVLNCDNNREIIETKQVHKEKDLKDGIKVKNFNVYRAKWAI